MANIRYIANVLNQKGAPAIFEDTFANRPSAGFVGRIFISIDTFVIQRDNGITWDSIGGAGGITGTGSTGQVTFFTGVSSVSGDNGLFWDNTNKRLGINTITPGVRLDIHGTGVIAQFNGITTNNAYLDFQNAGTTQWRVGNNYNGGNRLFQIIDQVGGNNLLTFSNNRQVGFNLPGTTFFSSGWAYQLHGLIGQTWDFAMLANNASGSAFVNQSVYATRNNTFGSYGATISGDQLYQLAFFGSTGAGYTSSSGGIIVTQNGTVGSFAPIDLRLVASNSSGVTTELRLRNAGYVEINRRLNVNGASDNANFELNNSGNLNTSGLTLGFISLSSNTTLTRTMSGILVTATCTLTLPTASGLGNIYYIFVASGVTATINRSGSDTITNKIGTTGLTSLTIVGGTSTMLYIKGGDNVTYQFF
jgi:hypothetical protein